MTFVEAVTGLLAHLRLHRYAPATIDNYADQLKRFGEWLSQPLADDLRRVTRADIDTYQAYVGGEPIGAECRALRLRAVKRLFDHLVREGRLLLHPADHVVEIRRKDRLDATRLYFNHMLALGRSDRTVKGARSALGQLLAFLATLDVDTVARLDREALMRYREELAWRLTAKGVPLAVRSQLELIGHVAAFCRFGVAQGWWLVDPSESIPRPKKPSRLPRSIMEPGEVERLLAMPDTTTLRGFRDRVMLEVLYSTALRREELANLRLDDVDIDTGYVFVREGKGGKDRVVPLGASVCDWVRSYLVDIRPQWPGVGVDRCLFLNRWGRGIAPNAVWAIVHKHAQGAGLTKPVATHTFRHSCATHMLRNGVPIRQLQEMLGHASLETTQLYTRVTINDLRAMHARFHPREQEPRD